MNATPVTPAGTGARKDEGHSARPGPDVPRGITWAAHAVPLCALPSGLWRIALVVGWPDWYAGHTWLPGERPYVLSLSLIAECLALLTLGLVRPWGERLPSWVPFVGGRAVPVRAAVVPASIGAFLATALVPHVATRIRSRFANVLGTPAGRIGELAALAEMLQAVARGFHPKLAPLLLDRAE
nr:hypothetical protein OG409_07335 [Streptomyces sp. NBC_00974]